MRRERLAHGRARREQAALGQLDPDHRAGHAVPLERLAHPVARTAGPPASAPRRWWSAGAAGTPRSRSRAGLGGDPLEHPRVDLDDQAGLLGDVDEVGGQRRAGRRRRMRTSASAALHPAVVAGRRSAGRPAPRRSSARARRSRVSAASRRSALARSSASNSAYWSRPAVLGAVEREVGLAVEVARVARSASVAIEMPMLTVATSAAAAGPRSNGRRSVSSSRAATACTASALTPAPRPGRRTRRRRAGPPCSRRGSRPRSGGRSRPAGRRRPGGPSESLTVLNRSTSSSSIASAPPAALQPGQRLVEPVVEQGAVGQPGQGVGEGEPLELGLLAQPVADVDGVGDQVERLAARRRGRPSW